MTKPTKQAMRCNFYATRLRRKLQLRRAMLDQLKSYPVSFDECDLPDQGSEHAAASSAGYPSQDATEKARPQQPGALSQCLRSEAKDTHDEH